MEIRDIVPKEVLRKLDLLIDPTREVEPLTGGTRLGRESFWLYPQYGAITLATADAVRRVRASKRLGAYMTPAQRLCALALAGECLEIHIPGSHWVVFVPKQERVIRDPLASNFGRLCGDREFHGSINE